MATHFACVPGRLQRTGRRSFRSCRQPLPEFTARGLVGLFAQVQRDGRGPLSVQQSYTVLSTCLEAPVTLEVLVANPMIKVRKPQWHAEDKRYWTVDETRRFLDVALASPRKWAPLCVFLVATGLRISEAFGLT